MKIKKLFNAPQFPYHKVLETLTGQYMMFAITPWRHITEADLHPVPGYQAKGKNAEEAPVYFYWMFGLEKEAK